MSSRGLLVLLVATIAAVGMIGMPVVAEGDELIAEDIETDDSLESVWADVTTTDDGLEDTDTVEVTFEVIGLEDADDDLENGTELTSDVVEIDANSTESFDYDVTDDDLDDDETLHLSVEVTDDEFGSAEIADYEWGTTESIVGGGTDGDGVTATTSTAALAALALGAVFLYTRD